MSPAQVRAAAAHLKKDPRFVPAIHARRLEWVRREPFDALCRAIIGQQLSIKAAATIYARFKKLYPERGLTSFRMRGPRAVAATSHAAFRSAGLSAQKAEYVLDLAQKFLDGTVNPKHFSKMSDDEIRTHLVAVKGIGRWTADMFLMFTLHRPDVLPTGDLGIQKAMQKLFGLKKLPTPARMEELAEPWRPHRTLACRYLWDLLDAA